MMQPFVYTSQQARVIFGAGSLREIAKEMDTLGARRALVLSTQVQRNEAQRVADLLGARCVAIFDQATMHVPIETARQARQVAHDAGADCAIAIGGGSTTGLGKAIALESSLPIIAIPTTYAGSEMTPIYGITEGGHKIMPLPDGAAPQGGASGPASGPTTKKTGRDARVLPKTVIYDPELSLGLPLALSITSGINAIAHAAEGMYAADANPITQLLGAEGIRAMHQGLTRIVGDATDLNARADCLYGAWLCGTVLGSVAMGLHHKLCHTLGGTYNLPHAETHTIILPHALAYNASAAPEAMKRIADALGTSDAPSGLYEWAKSLGAPVALKDIGMLESELDRCAEIASQDAYPNPRALEKNAIRALLYSAYHGHRPGR